MAARDPNRQSERWESDDVRAGTHDAEFSRRRNGRRYCDRRRRQLVHGRGNLEGRHEIRQELTPRQPLSRGPKTSRGQDARTLRSEPGRWPMTAPAVPATMAKPRAIAVSVAMITKMIGFSSGARSRLGMRTTA